LENHHALTLFSMLRIPACNILSAWTPEARRALRKTMLYGIMATDMAQHMSKIKELEQRDGPGFDFTKDTERLLVVGTMVHSADLSAQTLPTAVAKIWEERISLEFDAQAKDEAARGLPVMPFMQNLSDGLHRAKLQVSFIGFVLEPWWKNIVRLFPGVKACWSNLLANKAFFEGLTKSVSAIDEVKKP
jgi:hypothetical protein